MKIISSLVVAALFLSSGLSAQTKPCFSMNDATNSAVAATSAYGFAGSNFHALQWTPATTHVAHGMTIFTGTGSSWGGYQTLEIWSDDATTKQPKARLVGGTFEMPKSTSSGWYGTNFDKIQILSKGTKYWIIWGEPGLSALPAEPASASLLTRLWKTGATAAWKTGGSWGFKFRLYCSHIDQQFGGIYGTACSGTAGHTATSFANTAPKIGNAAFRIEATGIPSGAASILILGAKKTFPSIPFSGAAPGCFLNTDIVMLLVGVSGTGDHRAKPAVGATGHISFALPLPNTASLVGNFLGTQIAVHDVKSKNALPMVFTNALRITFQK